MNARREKGLCFKCNERSTLGHCCKTSMFLCLLVELDEPDEAAHIEEEFHKLIREIETPKTEVIFENPQISFDAFIRQFVPYTLKLACSINGKLVVVLIIDGSTNDFLQTRLANHLGLSIEPS